MSLAICVSLLFCSIVDDPKAPPANRDHGPGTAAGGVSVQSADLLKPEGFALSLRVDYTQFERLSPADIEERSFKVGGDHPHFDALRWSLLETIDLSYGVSESVQLGLSFGFYRGNDLREGHFHGAFGFHEFGDVSGLTDTWINAKVQVARSPGGRWAVFGGIKLPTGRDDVAGGSRPLEASLQPGSGTFDLMVGGAYSVWLSGRMALDASVAYTLRTEEDQFKIGDRADLGVAVAYRFTEEMSEFPRLSVFSELSARHLFRNQEDGENVVNSGGTVVFLAAGMRVAWTKHVSLSVAPQLPLLQALHDEQQETEFKVAFALEFSS